MTDLDASLFVTPAHHLTAVMRSLQETGRGICLVVDNDQHLLGVITDGDVRRALLAGTSLSAPVSYLLTGKPEPIVANVGDNSVMLLGIMRLEQVRQLPILDSRGRVVDLIGEGDILEPDSPNVEAVVMAGGYGRRLAPLTDTCPKPMLPVNGRPLLEQTVERLRDAGIHRVHLTVGYLADRIVEHFGNGAGYGVDVRYVTEDEPLGTAGSLGMVEADGPVLVVNGDLVCDIDYGAMVRHHNRTGADLTVAVKRQEWAIPYGVVSVQGDRVIDLVEKPNAAVFVNAGVYLVAPYVRASVPVELCHMTDVIRSLLTMGRKVAPWVMIEQWRDIGTPSEYRQAQEVKG